MLGVGDKLFLLEGYPPSLLSDRKGGLLRHQRPRRRRQRGLTGLLGVVDRGTWALGVIDCLISFCRMIVLLRGWRRVLRVRSRGRRRWTWRFRYVLMNLRLGCKARVLGQSFRSTWGLLRGHGGVLSMCE
jgi:hypothetical protein